MLAILQELHEDDYFAIILFDHQIQPWKPSLIKASKDNVAEALAFTRGIDDRGCKHQNKSHSNVS